MTTPYFDSVVYVRFFMVALLQTSCSRQYVFERGRGNRKAQHYTRSGVVPASAGRRARQCGCPQRAWICVLSRQRSRRRVARSFSPGMYACTCMYVRQKLMPCFFAQQQVPVSEKCAPARYARFSFSTFRIDRKRWTFLSERPTLGVVRTRFSTRGRCTSTASALTSITRVRSRGGKQLRQSLGTSTRFLCWESFIFTVTSKGALIAFARRVLFFCEPAALSLALVYRFAQHVCVWHSETPRDCNAAVMYLRSVAESSNFGHILRGAFDRFLAKDIDAAALLYLEAADAGFVIWPAAQPTNQTIERPMRPL